MLIKCLTPGCHQFVAEADVLCPECRRQSNNCVSVVDVWPDGQYDAFHPDEDLGNDLVTIAGFLTMQAQADAEQIALRETTVRRLQRKLDLRARIIRKLTDERDHEMARAEGLQDQVDGLREQVETLSTELAIIQDPAAGNGCTNGLKTVDTAPGDWRPFEAGYNTLWIAVDPITGGELLWRWYRAES